MQKDFILSSEEHKQHPLISPRDLDGIVPTETIWRTVFGNYRQFPAFVHNEFRRKLNLAEQISRMYSKGKFRKTMNPHTGEPYSPLEHFSSVSSITSNAGYSYRIATDGYLHDIKEMNGGNGDLDMMLSQIFSPRDLGIILAVTDLGAVIDDIIEKDPFYYKPQNKLESKENFRIGMLKEFLRYVEAIPIKLADRIHNLLTIDAMPLESKKRTILETSLVYEPIARCYDTLFYKAIKELNRPLMEDPSLRMYHADHADIHFAIKVMMDLSHRDERIESYLSYELERCEKEYEDVAIKEADRQVHMMANDFAGIEMPNPPSFDMLPLSVREKFDKRKAMGHPFSKEATIFWAWSDIISDLLFQGFTDRQKRILIDRYFRKDSEMKDLSATEFGSDVVTRLRDNGFSEGYFGAYRSRSGEFINHIIGKCDKSYHEFIDDLIAPLDIWRFKIPRPMIALDMRYKASDLPHMNIDGEMRGLRLIYDFLGNAPLMAKKYRELPEGTDLRNVKMYLKTLTTEDPYMVVDILGAKR